MDVGPRVGADAVGALLVDRVAFVDDGLPVDDVLAQEARAMWCFRMIT